MGLTDLRGDLRRFGILIACLALGTSVIAAVGSVGAGLKQAVERDASVLMGGDFEAFRPDRDANAQELVFLQSLGRVAHVVETTARGSAGDNSALIDLVAVGQNYPLAGAISSPQLNDNTGLASLLELRDNAYGILVDAVLLDRLLIKSGDRFRIGKTEFDVRGTLTSLPDGAVRGFHLGLTAVISTSALAVMTDLRAPLPGLLTQHRYKVMLDGISYEDASAAMRTDFDDVTWQIRSPRDAAGNLVRYYDLFARFLLIVGLSSLLVGGVGVSNGVTAYIGERQQSIAILRSLGATGARILVHFLAQIAVLTFIGVGIGVASGALASVLIMPLVGQALNVNLPTTLEPIPLLTAAGFGILAGFAYSYLPLMRAQKVSPVLLFRAPGAVMPPLKWTTMLRLSVVAPLVLATMGILGLAVLSTNDVMLVLFYAIGAILAYAILRSAAWVLQRLLAMVPPLPSVSWRNAMRNIYSPGSSASVVIVSVGLGLTMLLVIVLLQSNLNTQLLGAVSRDAPSFVVTDLFADEVAELEEMAQNDPALAKFAASPMLRGAVINLNGVDPASFKNLSEEAALLTAGDIPLTWLRELPEGSTLVEGAWWPADYQGPPLISLRTSMKAQLGLKVGDTIQFKLFGETIDATIANFRDYQWQNGLNFLVSFSPGLIEDYPSTFLGTIKAAEGKEKDVERDLAHRFPDIAFIPIGDALSQIASVLGQLGLAVSIVGGLAVINGLLVLAGTLAAGRKRREADAVIQKVLGATRGNVLTVFMIEYGLLGAFAALIAASIGVGGAWAITRNAFDVDYSINVVLILMVVATAICVTIAAGAITIWRALSARPAQFLRET